MLNGKKETMLDIIQNRKNNEFSEVIRTLVLGNCDYVTLSAQMTLQMGFQLRIVRWGDNPVLSSWIQSNHTSH